MGQRYNALHHNPVITSGCSSVPGQSMQSEAIISLELTPAETNPVIFTRRAGENDRRRFASFLCSCDVFRALRISSLRWLVETH